MSGALISFLEARAPRERLLLGVLVLGVLPLALVFTLLLPLAETRQAAEARLDEAVALQGWVAARAGEVAARPPADAAAATEAPEPVGAGALEQSLIEARLRDSLERLEQREGGRLALRFDNVVFRDAMIWMSAQDPRWGYGVETLRITPTEESGRVAVDLVLAPPG